MQTIFFTHFSLIVGISWKFLKFEHIDLHVGCDVKRSVKNNVTKFDGQDWRLLLAGASVSCVSRRHISLREPRGRGGVSNSLMHRKDLNTEQTEFVRVVTVMTDHSDSGKGRSHFKHTAKPSLHQNKHSEQRCGCAQWETYKLEKQTAKNVMLRQADQQIDPNWFSLPTACWQ